MTIKIIYETQTGTTQYVAELAEKELQNAGHQVQMHSILKSGMTPDFSGVDVVILGAPTYDDGFLETHMRDFVETFSVDLAPYKVAVFALGARSYPQFCKAAYYLEEWISKNNGKVIVPTLQIDGFPDDTKQIEEWTKSVLAAMTQSQNP